MKNWLMAVLSAALLLTGSHTTPEPTCRVVETITVQSEGGTRVYTEPEQLRAILHYLRRAEALGPAQIPASPKSAYEICLTDSGGCTGTYALWDLEFFRNKNGQWQRIDPEWGQCLPLLMEILDASQYS